MEAANSGTREAGGRVYVAVKRTQQRGSMLVLAAGFRVAFRLDMIVKFQSEEWKARMSESLCRLPILRHLSLSLLVLSPNDAAPLSSALRFLAA